MAASTRSSAGEGVMMARKTSVSYPRAAGAGESTVSGGACGVRGALPGLVPAKGF